MSASALLLAASGAVRAVSLNLCTDEYLLLLAAPHQIASVTHLSHSAAETPLWKMARNHPKNDGSLLSIASRKPTVVFTMGGGVRGRSEIAKKLRIKVVDLPYPQRIGDVEAAIRQVATALSREQRGRQLLAQIGALKRTRPSQAADTIWLGGGGRTVTADGLAADWMRLAGLRQRPLPSDRVSLEQLLVAPPGVLLRSDYRSGQYSGEQRWLSHPLARNVKAGRTLPTDGRRWTCMGPTMIGEIVRLRRALNG